MRTRVVVAVVVYVIFLAWAYYQTFVNPCTMPIWTGDRPAHCTR